MWVIKIKQVLLQSCRQVILISEEMFVNETVVETVLNTVFMERGRGFWSERFVSHQRRVWLVHREFLSF